MADNEATHVRDRRGLKSRKLAWICAFAAWTTVTGVALAALTDYASRAGSAAHAPTSWPSASRLTRTRGPGRSTLVMVAHTKCSCTRASLVELERVMAHAGARLEAIVVFVGPHEGSGLGGVLDLRERARSIPRVRVVEDETEARLFGAETSGQALLYDDAGALVFRGGMSVARGHEGESVGGDLVLSIVARTTGAPASSTPTPASKVFGCALFDNDTPQKER